MSLESGIYLFDRVAFWMAIIAIVYELAIVALKSRIAKLLNINSVLEMTPSVELDSSVQMSAK